MLIHCLSAAVVGYLDALRRLRVSVRILVTHGTRVPDVEPLAEARCVEVVVAASLASVVEFLEADRADVVELTQLVVGGEW